MLSQEQEPLTKDIPAEILFKEKTRTDYSISPDGKYYADLLSTNVENDIIIVDIDAYELRQRIPMGHQSVDNMYWLTSNRLLYESEGALYAIDIDGTNKKQIVDRRSEVAAKKTTWDSYFKGMRFNSLVSLMPEKEHQILIESFDLDFHSSIKEVNIFSGQRLVIVDGSKYKINRWILDKNRKIRLGIRFSDTGVDYFEFDQENGKLTPFYIVIDGISYNPGILTKNYFKPAILFEAFSADPDVIYITSNLDGDKRKLLSYSLSQKKVLEVLAEDAICDVRETYEDKVAFFYDYKNHMVGGVRYNGLTPQFRFFSSYMAEIQQKLNTKYPRHIHEFLDSDMNGDRHVILQWSDINSGNVGIYDARDDSYVVMFHFNEELAKYKLTATRTMVIPSREGKNIPCYVSLPLDYNDSKPIPLVVLPHGGPWARDYWDSDPFSQFFTSRGYATLRVNFRGSTGFGLEHLRSGIDNLHEVMINDIVDAVNGVKEKYAIQDKAVFIYGHSYGGYASYMGLIKYPNDFAAGVAVSAPTDIKAWMKDLKRSDMDYAYEFWTEALGNKKSRYLDEISPLHFADQLHKPIMIFHGEYDRTIPVEQAEKMEKALVKHNYDVSFEVMKKEGHSFGDGNTMSYVLNRAHSFFQKYMPKED